MDKSPTLSDRILQQKPDKKPTTSSDPAIVLGEIYQMLVDKRQEDLRYQEEKQNFKTEYDEEEERKRQQLLKAIRGIAPKKEKEKIVVVERKKKDKSLFEKFYPGGVTGVITDIAIITGVILATTKDAEAANKKVEDIKDIPLEEEPEKPETKPEPKTASEEKPTTEAEPVTVTGTRETPEPLPEKPKTVPKEEKPVVTDSSGQPVLDSSGQPIKMGEPEVPVEVKPKIEKLPPKEEPSAVKIPEGKKDYGYLTKEQMSKIISTHEGNAESVYGDYTDRQTKETKNIYGLRPQEWSEKTLGKRKKLTEFTFREVLQYQKYRNSVKESTGAVGIAGFMPSTLFGQKLDGQAGLFKSSGLSWDDTFSEQNQKLLQSVLDKEQDKILLNGLKRLGYDSITPGIKLAANYVGPAGVLAVIEEGQKDANITVAEALEKRFPKQGDVTKGGLNKLRSGATKEQIDKDKTVINKDLLFTKAKDFVTEKEKYVIKKSEDFGFIKKSEPVAPPSSTTGPKISQMSQQNSEMKDTIEKQKDKSVNVVNVAMNNQVSNKASQPQEPVDDKAIYIKKNVA